MGFAFLGLELSLAGLLVLVSLTVALVELRLQSRQRFVGSDRGVEIGVDAPLPAALFDFRSPLGE
jgi:hypothetical protein